jgi:hypothetical protein
VDSAKTAIGAGDYATAANYKAQIDLELLATPDSITPESELRWGRDASKAIGDWLDRKGSATTGIQFKKVNRVTPGLT